MLQPTAPTGSISFAAGTLDPEFFPYRTLRQLLASISRRKPQLLSTYALSPGLRAFHNSIAATYARWGCTLRPDEIVTAAGCMEAITICLRAVTHPGDLVAVESPTFFGLLQALEYQHLKVVEIPTHSEHGMSLDALEVVLRTMPVKAVIASPNLNNPLGGSMSLENKRRLVGLIDTADIPLIEDDGYGDFAEAPVRALPAKAFDRHGRVMLCSSFTKSLAPGFRLGWVSGGRYHNRVELLKMMTSMGSPPILESVLATYLASGGYERFLRRLRARLVEQRQEYADVISDCFPEGTRLSSPAGGYLLWVELPDGVATDLLMDHAAGRSYAPGVVFSASGREFRNCLRIGVGRKMTPDIMAALQHLGRTFIATRTSPATTAMTESTGSSAMGPAGALSQT
jgi:DNA-binding transcriptional MocR family regulator